MYFYAFDDYKNNERKGFWLSFYKIVNFVKSL